MSENFTKNIEKNLVGAKIVKVEYLTPQDAWEDL
jgi:hypothetical protein